MKITAEPRSDQWNADDFAGGPRTFTIAGVVPGKAEQKYDIQLVEGEGRVWRPPLTMLRVLVAAWSDEAETWKGRRVTLYTDPTIRFGRDVVGGIRISHLSGIEKPLQIASTVTRGKRATLTVQPLADAPPTEDRAATAITALRNAPTITELEKLWARVLGGGLDSVPAVKAAYDDRAKVLSGMAAEQ